MKSFFLLIVAAFLLSATAMPQTIDINAQIRPRAEYKHGYKSLIGDNVDPAFAISQRSRLNMNYGSKTLNTVLSIQDVRIWGDAATANKSDVNGTMLYQVWGELFLAENFSLKAGRQVISYDDQRLFGALDWVQQGRSHDAFLVKYSPVKKVAIHLGIAYNQSADKDTGNFYTVNNYKALQYLVLVRKPLTS